jgi:hypothetical protein
MFRAAATNDSYGNALASLFRLAASGIRLGATADGSPDGWCRATGSRRGLLRLLTRPAQPCLRPRRHANRTQTSRPVTPRARAGLRVLDARGGLVGLCWAAYLPSCPRTPRREHVAALRTVRRSVDADARSVTEAGVTSRRPRWTKRRSAAASCPLLPLAESGSGTRDDHYSAEPPQSDALQPASQRGRQRRRSTGSVPADENLSRGLGEVGGGGRGVVSSDRVRTCAMCKRTSDGLDAWFRRCTGRRRACRRRSPPPSSIRRQGSRTASAPPQQPPPAEQPPAK